MSAAISVIALPKLPTSFLFFSNGGCRRSIGGEHRSSRLVRALRRASMGGYDVRREQDRSIRQMGTNARYPSSDDTSSIELMSDLSLSLHFSIASRFSPAQSWR